MKKKILIFMLLAISLFSLTACKSNKIDLNDYLIEKRVNLYTAEDDLYSVTFSSGTREENYAFDGQVGNMIEFGALTFSRLDGLSLANDSYTYTVTINENNYTGFLDKSEIDNSYSADIGVAAPNDATINVQISFTGYSFNQDLINTSSSFSIDSSRAIEIANDELQDSLETMKKNNDGKIEAVIKNVKDYSNSESLHYYWYVGAVASDGDTIGILIDAASGEVVAKKV